MAKKDKRVDDYIAKAQPFAQPILTHIRELVHKAVPEVEEAWKWSFPHFDYKGAMCSMASFKQHCAFGFWKQSLMKDPDGIFPKEKTAMGHMGRVKSLDDLPSDKIMIKYIKEAAKLNEEGAKVVKPKKAPKKEIPPPDYFLKALNKNKKALKAFDAFSPSHKREYLEWITEAKSEDTRNKRMAQAIEWMSEGKSRNWKYQK